MKTITEAEIREFPGIRIGQTEDTAAGTGITVILSEDPQGMAAGLHIGGGGPATRETGILDPTAAAQRIHAAVLGGGSAFGLDAAGGVMRYLEERGIGVNVHGIHVPLVTQVDIFDLLIGDPARRPDQQMGYEACKASEQKPEPEGAEDRLDPGRRGRGNYRDGNFGAGCGATVGKYRGIRCAMKSGIGSCVLRQGDLLVGAVIAVNAFGDIYDWRTGRKTAGARDGSGRLYTQEEMFGYLREIEEQPITTADNTTIGVVFTNARFDKAQLCKIAAMAHDGLARVISPVHTSADGDSIIALSAPGDQDVSAGIDTTGTLAVRAVSEAILRGVNSAESAFGLPAVRDLL